MKRKAFTLIELLVVVAIIALLISILVPTLSLARSISRRTACLANMHGVGLALATYVSEYGSWPSNNSVGNNMMCVVLAPYLRPQNDINPAINVNKIYYCPEETNHGTTGDLGIVTRQWFPSDNSAAWPTTDRLAARSLIIESGWRKETDVGIRTNLANIVVAGDARRLVGGVPFDGYHFIKPWYTVDYLTNSNPAATFFPRHTDGKSIALLFADGRAEPMKWSDFIQQRNTSAGLVYNFLMLGDPRGASYLD